MNEAYLKTFFFVWPFTLGVALTLFIVGLFIEPLNALNLALSFGLGGVVSVMLASMNYRSLKKHEGNPSKWAFVTRRNYLFRYLMYGLILSISYLSDDFYFIVVFTGFLSFKSVLLISVWLHRKDIDHG